jgi:hypothetical protein
MACLPTPRGVFDGSLNDPHTVCGAARGTGQIIASTPRCRGQKMTVH